MSQKKRKPQHTGLPSRWEYHHGAYYYRPRAEIRNLWDDKVRFRLGKTLSEAYRVFAGRVDASEPGSSVAALLDRYALEIVPKKALRTQDTELPLIPQLKDFLGHIPVVALSAVHVYQMLDAIDSKSKGNRMVAVISHACTYAIRWGLREDHPVKGRVVRHSQGSRSRYVETDELRSCFAIAPPLIRAYIPVKLCTGARKSGILRIRNADVTDAGLSLTESKTAERKLYEMDETLTAAVDNARLLMPKDIAPWLFHTRKGACYVKDNDKTSGFDSVWQRWMQKCLEQELVSERFQEHDLRAKTASDSDSETRAAELLGSKLAVVKKHYLRRPRSLKPHDPGL